MAFNYTRYGSYIGSTVNLKTTISNKTGVINNKLPYAEALFQIDRVTFNAAIAGLYGPTLTQQKSYIYGTGSVTDTSWKDNTSFFNVTNGISQFTIPKTANYRITASGASHTNTNTGVTGGQGVRIRATFSLEMGKYLWILVGQQNEQPSSGRNWGGGAGGTFVTYGDSFATSIPLVIAGGGGLLRSGDPSLTYNGLIPNNYINGQTTTFGARSYGASITANYGQAGLGGHNQSTGGSAAGWASDGSTHTDLRNVPTSFIHNGVTYNYGGSYDEAKTFYNGGAGGQFRTNYDTTYIGDGGFGGGSPGGWNGLGGGGGYSGGNSGNNNNSNSFSGGGGSFIYYDVYTPDQGNFGTSTGTWTLNGVVSTHPVQPLGSLSSGIATLSYNTGGGSVIIKKLN